MYRVITQYRNGGTHPVVERGPWHTDQSVAEFWAGVLREQGYVVNIEDQHMKKVVAGAAPAAKDDNSDLLAALSSMA